MKRDIILTCEYNDVNLQFFKRLESCPVDELTGIVYPLFFEICGVTFHAIEHVLMDVGSFKGGFVALTMNLDEEDSPGTEHIYHSDMVMFMDIHKEDYNQDPDKNLVIFENEEHETVFSTQLYPVFLKDERENQMICDMSIQRLWSLVIRLKPDQKQLRNRLMRRKEIQKLLKYR